MADRIAKKDMTDIFGYLEERFGLDRKLFEHHSFLRTRKGRIFLFSGLHGFSMKTEVSAGLPFARISRSGVIKPSTAAIQLFGSQATRGVVSLSREQAAAFASGADIALEHAKITDGYVIVRYKQFSLGCGHLSEGVMKNMLPKGKRMRVELI
jgi:NOL1/NOP2/fmu family ribosome biogenesis protein